MTQLF